MKQNLSLLLLLLLSAKAFACSCPPNMEFTTKEDLKEYAFIAHVRISGIEAAEDIDTDSYIHRAFFEILELYKGKKIGNLLVSGSHPSLEGWTSCDLGEMIGEEWILFGRYSGRLKALITGYCSRSREIRSRNGFENLEYPNQKTLKKQLQLLFEKEQKEPQYQGERVEYYPNGNRQLEENYANGRLNGSRCLWYPNGVLQSTQYYKEGKKEGIFKWYSEKGELTKREKFRNDIPIDTTTLWREIDTSAFHLRVYSEFNKVDLEQAKEILSRRQVWIERVFNDKGELLSKTVYRQNGKKESEKILVPEEDREINRSFHENGALRSEGYRKDWTDTGIYREWDENGNLVRSWEYDENGKVLQESKIVN